MDAGLLDGPRGRRLCLAVAAGASAGVHTPLFDAAYALHPGSGISRVILRSGDGGWPTPPGPVADIDRLAAEIDAVDPGRIDAAAVERALPGVVDAATYWQDPGGEDVVAALPSVRTALARIAAHVDALPGLEWWRAVSGSARSITWGDGTRASRDRPTLDAWREATRAEEERATAERPTDPTARWSGTWWSTPDAPWTVAHLPLALGLVEDRLGWDRATTFPAGDPGRTLELQEPDDWVELCRRHPLPVTASRRHDWFRTTGGDTGWVIPDWTRVAQDFDAVHLTVDAYLRTAGRALKVAPGWSTVLAGWNPDATLWLRRAPLRTGRDIREWVDHDGTGEWQESWAR